MPKNPHVFTATAHLLLKKAIAAAALATAQEYKDEAIGILKAQMASTKDADVHPYHIFGSQMMSYIGRWVAGEKRSDEFRRIHDELRDSIPNHLRGHPELRKLLSDLKRAELETLIRK